MVSLPDGKSVTVYTDESTFLNIQSFPMFPEAENNVLIISDVKLL
jgi:hypothetical protein